MLPLRMPLFQIMRNSRGAAPTSIKNDQANICAEFSGVFGGGWNARQENGICKENGFVLNIRGYFE
jgi:hypothetical protein